MVIVMLSNKRTNLAVMESRDWERLTRKYCELRGWWPNQPAYSRVNNGHPPEFVINCQHSGELKHFSLSYKLLTEAIEAEKAGKIIQAYVRLCDHQGNMIAQNTAQNVWRILQHVRPARGRYGDYWWINERFEPQDPVNPADMGCPF
jgi:hypothetical protein